MNKNKIVIGFLMLCMSVSLSGCVDNNGVEGTYYLEDGDGVLDLLPANHYELESEECLVGSYTVRRDTVRLHVEFLSMFIPLKIDGRDLIDPEGERWVRD